MPELKGEVMSHFYGSVMGSARTEATRRGGAVNGLDAHVRGWDLGVYVAARHVEGVDVFYLYETKGSNGERKQEDPDRRKLVGVVGPLGFMFPKEWEAWLEEYRDSGAKSLNDVIGKPQAVRS